MTKPYHPNPIDTSGVWLASELQDHIERLAESVHDYWALQRLEEGWTYGAERDDERKTHPDLVPYTDLSESAKEFDRTSVVETLRAVIALGYEIRSTKVP